MFQTGQLLLRQQIHAIMELWQLPSELEVRLQTPCVPKISLTLLKLPLRL